LAALATLREFDRGDYLSHAGDPAESLTILVKGRVKIVSQGEAGDVILELYEEGEPVGAIAVYNYMPYPASAVSLEPVTLLVVPRRDHFELLNRHPGLARALLRELTKRTVALLPLGAGGDRHDRPRSVPDPVARPTPRDRRRARST
jgi:CRP-like cAMP-binding protein